MRSATLEVVKQLQSGRHRDLDGLKGLKGLRLLACLTVRAAKSGSSWSQTLPIQCSFEKRTYLRTFLLGLSHDTDADNCSEH